MGKFGKFKYAARELPEGREGTPVSMKGVREYTKKFLLEATTKEVDPIEAVFAPGVPRQWSPYYSWNGEFTDELALMTDASARQKQDDDWGPWIVTCKYTTEIDFNREIPNDQNSGGSDPRNKNGEHNNPEFEPPEYEWTAEIENIALPVDLDGKAWLNSANEPLKPAPTIPVAFPVFNMVRNELKLTMDTICDYSMAINTDKFMTAPPGFALCMPIRAKQVAKGPLRYWRATYQIKFHWSLIKGNNQVVQNFWNNAILGVGNAPQGVAAKGPFQPLVPDTGMSELRNVLENGVQVKKPFPIIPAPSVPVMLDGAGLRAKVDAKLNRIIPHLLQFKAYKEKPFAQLFKNFNFIG